MKHGHERSVARADPGQPDQHPRPRPAGRWLRAVPGVVFVGVVLTSTLAVVTAERPASQATSGATTTSGNRQSPIGTADNRLAPGLPTTAVLPGAAPRLPWPSTGSATVDIDGVGSLGGSIDQRPAPIASLAKVMTAYVILREHPMNTNDNGADLTVTDAEATAYASDIANNESAVKVAAGEVLTERQALEALLLPSADNIGRILARWDAGSIPTFVTKMNATAAVLGMTSTHYNEPSGADPATRSTAGDQVLLATHAMRLPAFAKIVAMPTATIPVAGTVHNYNTLLGSDGVIGIKTGSTSAAGGCLLFAAQHPINGRTATIIGAVLGQHGASMYGLPEALSASTRLIQATADAVGTYTPIKAGQKVATIGGTSLVAAADITTIGWPGLSYRLTMKTTNAPAATSHKPGIQVGRLELDAGAERATTAMITGAS